MPSTLETRLDTSIFDSRHKNDETGCPAYDPKVLLKVVLLAYSPGIISSRRIEKVLSGECDLHGCLLQAVSGSQHHGWIRFLHER